MTGLIKNELLKLAHNRKTYGFILALLMINIIPVLLTLLIGIRTMDGQSYPSTLYGFTVSWVLPLFLIAIIAELITEEYSAGTLSLSLVHPVTRVQLITAKAVAIFILILAGLLYALLLGYGIGTLFFGWGSGFFMRGISYTTWEGIRITLGSYLGSAVPLLSFSLMIMFLALIMSSGASVVGASAGLLLIFTILDLLAEEISPFLISSYFVVTHLFLSFNRQEVSFTLAFLLLHSLLFYLAAMVVLQKKDIVN